ncbi:hypothetical protein GCM10007874_11200 [Labrys miyagiensis]|uniref:Uncharacterized protein n=1 Tax=Labrys miyagiensis TaxID=346912 RepID=A0ABQ6CHA9_9HYPH|nr:hypothetical protein GCM10007874_11200 [Labrys miyagiensis]
MTSLMQSKTGKINKFKRSKRAIEAWQPSPSLSPAARRIARRFRLAPATAELICRLSGLGQEVGANG